MSTRRRWSREETAQLIERYEAAPALWDTASPEYRDREKKAAALYAMAGHFATTSSEVTRKLHNLRCQMNNEIRKQRHRNAHAWRKDPYVSSWEFYNSLRFINVEAETSEAVDSYAELPQETQHVEKMFKQELVIQDPREPRAPEACSRPPKRRKSKLKGGPGGRAPDEHQVFGDFVASELRAARAAGLGRRLRRLIARDVLRACRDSDEEAGAAPVYIGSPVRCSDASEDDCS